MHPKIPKAQNLYPQGSKGSCPVPLKASDSHPQGLEGSNLYPPGSKGSTPVPPKASDPRLQGPQTHTAKGLRPVHPKVPKA